MTGETLPPLTRELSIPRLMIYGAATWDFHRLHYAPTDGSAPLVDGQHFGGLLAKHALDWAGPRSRVRRMSFRFTAPVFAGTTVQVDGEVTGVESSPTGGSVVAIAQTVTADGQAVVKGTLELEVPA